jgi:hypothetical protein
MLRPNSWRRKNFPLILDIVNSLGPVEIELQEAPSWQLHDRAGHDDVKVGQTCCMQRKIVIVLVARLTTARSIERGLGTTHQGMTNPRAIDAERMKSLIDRTDSPMAKRPLGSNKRVVLDMKSSASLHYRLLLPRS